MNRGIPRQELSLLPFVFDASALINIAASGYCVEILASLGRKCLAETIVWRELSDHIEKYDINKNIELAVSNEHLDIGDMVSHESTMFLNLITAPHPNTLDDGEAATIAVAHFRGSIAIIDEKKGRRIAETFAPPVQIMSTLDLFRMIENNCNSKDVCLNSALFNSLTQARMRVPVEHETWVINRLSSQQIEQCQSLPRRLREEVCKFSRYKL